MFEKKKRHDPKDKQSESYLIYIMRKPAFCICENKVADQQRADQLVCVCYINSTIPQLLKFEISNLQSSSVAHGTARLVLDLVGNPEYVFSYDASYLLTWMHICMGVLSEYLYNISRIFTLTMSDGI